MYIYNGNIFINTVLPGGTNLLPDLYILLSILLKVISH